MDPRPLRAGRRGRRARRTDQHRPRLPHRGRGHREGVPPLDRGGLAGHQAPLVRAHAEVPRRSRPRGLRGPGREAPADRPGVGGGGLDLPRREHPAADEGLEALQGVRQVHRPHAGRLRREGADAPAARPLPGGDRSERPRGGVEARRRAAAEGRERHHPDLRRPHRRAAGDRHQRRPARLPGLLVEGDGALRLLAAGLPGLRRRHREGRGAAGGEARPGAPRNARARRPQALGPRGRPARPLAAAALSRRGGGRAGAGHEGPRGFRRGRPGAGRDVRRDEAGPEPRPGGAAQEAGRGLPEAR